MNIPVGVQWTSFSLTFVLFLRFDSLVCTSDNDNQKIIRYDKSSKPSPSLVAAPDLQCYSCWTPTSTGEEKPNCMHMTDDRLVDKRNCSRAEIFCKVRKVLRYGKVTSFERNCASECRPGCSEAAYYEQCTTCCSDNSLCNSLQFSQITNTATSQTLKPVTILLTAQLLSSALCAFFYQLQAV